MAADEGRGSRRDEIHGDMALLGEIIEDVCYRNAVRFFKFREKQLQE